MKSSRSVRASAVPHVRLRHLEIDTIIALAAGDVDAASRSSGLRITRFVTDDRALWLWQVSVAKRLDPAEHDRWLACAVLRADGGVVGHAGFHGPPSDGVVEIGYSIDPAHRLRGYGRGAVGALLDEARSCSTVDRVRASIESSNTASFATIAGFGFVAVGDRRVEGGLEIILERPLHLPETLTGPTPPL